MTDLEFLDEMERRAGEHCTVFLSIEEASRMYLLGNLSASRSKDSWWAYPSDVVKAVDRARQLIALPVLERLKS